ncbi:hypothetical protein F8144_28510 [Streptomyces triticiradicis]|uniref:Uncharacterized protein n=1 Tax=Streptomyces triticiradicis TaxID=2651189 RepID=A0A7J5DBX2_9ACTN|nr:hypothetical protein F8144_28510 [Streptomyces triticiradicis]
MPGFAERRVRRETLRARLLGRRPSWEWLLDEARRRRPMRTSGRVGAGKPCRLRSFTHVAAGSGTAS